MSPLRQDLEDTVKEILAEAWTERDGQIVPEPEDLQLGNDAVKLKGTVLYADMADSTVLVDQEQSSLAAEVYKCYLACAARIIKAHNGAITAYDGDRVMAVFIGNYKNTSAATSALKINWAVQQIINPGLLNQYGQEAYQLRHVIGIDTSSLFVARMGVRNDNDLVWVGRAANYAAKLSAVSGDYPVLITGEVFDKLADNAKYAGEERELMWEERVWPAMNRMRVHRSNWTWEL